MKKSNEKTPAETQLTDGELMAAVEKNRQGDQEKPMNDGLTGKCELCNQSAKKTCGGCNITRYCTSDHQKEDWKQHKQKCQQIQQERAGLGYDQADVEKCLEFVLVTIELSEIFTPDELRRSQIKYFTVVLMHNGTSNSLNFIFGCPTSHNNVCIIMHLTSQLMKQLAFAPGATMDRYCRHYKIGSPEATRNGLLTGTPQAIAECVQYTKCALRKCKRMTKSSSNQGDKIIKI